MASFTVTSVTERPSINAAGNVVQSVVLTIQTTLGATGQVEIPSNQYEALLASEEGKTMLRDRLAQKADTLDAPFSM